MHCLNQKTVTLTALVRRSPVLPILVSSLYSVRGHSVAIFRPVKYLIEASTSSSSKS